MKQFSFFYACIAVLMGLSAFSCSNDDDTFYEDNKENRISTKAMGGSYQVLGYGYDITGEYLARQSIKDVVIDVEKLINEKPNFFKKVFVDEIKNEVYLGEDYYSYLKEIYNKSNFKGSVAESPKEARFDDSNKENIPYAFSSSFNSELTNKYEMSNKYSFARVDMMKHHRQYLLSVTPENVTNYLTESFETDLNRLSPDDIVSKYGTHVLLDFVVGGSYSLFYKSIITDNTTQVSKQKILSGGVAGALQKVGLNIILNLSKEEIEEFMVKNNQRQCVINIRGGSIKGDSLVINSNSTFTQTLDFDKWAETVDDQRSVLAEINFNKTYPIYEFISDPLKKEQIKNAVVRYLNSKEQKVLKTKTVYLLKSRETGDTYWVFTREEVEYGVNRWGEQYHGVLGFILTEPQPNTKPLYRLKRHPKIDTWYVFSEEEMKEKTKKRKRRFTWESYNVFEGMDGYIFDKEPTDIETLPMYRLRSKNSGDTWYDTSWNDYQYMINKWGDTGYGLQGYIIK